MSGQKRTGGLWLAEQTVTHPRDGVINAIAPGGGDQSADQRDRPPHAAQPCPDQIPLLAESAARPPLAWIAKRAEEHVPDGQVGVVEMELKINARRRQNATCGHDRLGAAASIAIIATATLNTIRGIIIVRPPVRFCPAFAGAP